jgi:hypothetical protein
MPLGKIDMIKGVRSPEEIKKLADVVQEVMLQKFNAPLSYSAHHPSNSYNLTFFSSASPIPYMQIQSTHSHHARYQIITQHEPYEIICEDTNLNFPRTNKLVLIQIFQQGRNVELKQAVYKELQERLEKECAVAGTDLIVSCSVNMKEDWSFGMGRAQFLTGEL